MESGGSFLLHISMLLQKHFPQGSNQIQGACTYQYGVFWIACLLCQILCSLQGHCWLWYCFLGLRYHIGQQSQSSCCPRASRGSPSQAEWQATALSGTHH